MEYQIALSAELELTSADFVAAWNASEACREMGEARLASSTSTHYDAARVSGGNDSR